MNDEEKEMLKNLDLLMNLELVQNESDWDVIQNMDLVDDKTKVKESGSDDELKLEEE